MRIKRTKAEMERTRKRIAARRSRRAAHHRRKRGGKKIKSAIISPITADLMGQMVILRVLENIGIRGRDIIELLAKAIVNPPTPTADQRESGTAPSTGKTRARSNKKERATKK